MPARQGLQQTTRAATRYGARETNRTFDSPFLLRQGEHGTSQYVLIQRVGLHIASVMENIECGYL